MLIYLQKLEDTVLSTADDSTPHRAAAPPYGGVTSGIVGRSDTTPARIREILTTHLSCEDLTDKMAAPTSDQLMEENRMLQLELNRVEDLLSSSRAERDEVCIKYTAVAERVSGLTLF